MVTRLEDAKVAVTLDTSRAQRELDQLAVETEELRRESEQAVQTIEAATGRRSRVAAVAATAGISERSSAVRRRALMSRARFASARAVGPAFTARLGVASGLAGFGKGSAVGRVLTKGVVAAGAITTITDPFVVEFTKALTENARSTGGFLRDLIGPSLGDIIAEFVQPDLDLVNQEIRALKINVQSGVQAASQTVGALSGLALLGVGPSEVDTSRLFDGLFDTIKFNNLVKNEKDVLRKRIVGQTFGEDLANFLGETFGKYGLER